MDPYEITFVAVFFSVMIFIAIRNAVLRKSPGWVQKNKRWENLMNQVNTLAYQGRYAETSKLNKQTLEIAEGQLGPDQPEMM